MTPAERVDEELLRVRPQFTVYEWAALRNVVKAALERIAVDACCGRCECHDNTCPIHGIEAARKEKHG